MISATRLGRLLLAFGGALLVLSVLAMPAEAQIRRGGREFRHPPRVLPARRPAVVVVRPPRPAYHRPHWGHGRPVPHYPRYAHHHRDRGSDVGAAIVGGLVAGAVGGIIAGGLQAEAAQQ